MPAAKEMSDAIDGDDRTSWHLPLPPLNSSSLEPHSPGMSHVVRSGRGIVFMIASNAMLLTLHAQANKINRLCSDRAQQCVFAAGDTPTRCFEASVAVSTVRPVFASKLFFWVLDSMLDICAAGEDPDLDKLRAVHRLVENHEAVVKFAARGCGQQGSPPVNAPLSDPNAKPGMQYVDAVDAGQSLIECSPVLLLIK